MRPADRAWLTLAAGVALYDVLAPPDEMLSEASARYTVARPLLWGSTVIYLAGHLLHVWRYDPLSGLARAIRRVGGFPRSIPPRLIVRPRQSPRQ